METIKAIQERRSVKHYDASHAMSEAECKELIEFGAPVLHFYTMGKPDQTKEIAKAVF